MEPVLTNRFRLSEDNLRLAVREQLRTPTLLNEIFAVLMLAVAVYLAASCFRTSPMSLSLAFRPLVFLAIAAFLFYQARTAEKRAVDASVKRIDETVGRRDSDVIVQFLPEYYLCENSIAGGSMQRQYEDIVEILRGRKLICLRLRDRGQFFLDPDRFENGAEAEFWRLMNEKCPKAVPLKYRKA